MRPGRDPKPLFCQLRAEVESFEAGGHAVERRAPDEFGATPPER
ncbi:hypothetical protein ACFQPA_18575 [Halomarina halobia]|uniref:Uncharacterized protein n=1 Tax=Halomarina halobia TaxID=3033386 RepID=A0ABD6ADG3_9EURY|nr:hypothetical protein [Halomarina sp. PSR21]